MLHPCRWSTGSKETGLKHPAGMWWGGSSALLCALMDAEPDPGVGSNGAGSEAEQNWSQAAAGHWWVLQALSRVR